MELNDKTVFEITGLSLEQTLFCGQCFRFKRDGGAYFGVIGDAFVRLACDGERLTVFHNGGPGFDGVLSDFFALNVDYDGIKRVLSRDATLKEAITYAPGIRVLNQPLFETVISFIISQNNNIGRITGIIDRLCYNFGPDMGGYHAFPCAAALASLSADDLAPLRCGFRDKYILDAAGRFACGDIDEAVIYSAPLDEARAELMKIKGVGPKVADCSLLFGAKRYDAFPADVWIKRAMAELFPSGLPEYALPYAGIAQQYIFHYARTSGVFERATVKAK